MPGKKAEYICLNGKISRQGRLQQRFAAPGKRGSLPLKWEPPPIETEMEI